MRATLSPRAARVPHTPRPRRPAGPDDPIDRDPHRSAATAAAATAAGPAAQQPGNERSAKMVSVQRVSDFIPGRAPIGPESNELGLRGVKSISLLMCAVNRTKKKIITNTLVFNRCCAVSR